MKNALANGVKKTAGQKFIRDTPQPALLLSSEHHNILRFANLLRMKQNYFPIQVICLFFALPAGLKPVFTVHYG